MKSINKIFEITAFFTSFSFEWNNGFAYDGESHNFWEIVYVASGAVQVSENERVYNLSKGEIILHAPLEFHSISCEKDTPTNVLIITFSVNGALPSNLSDGSFHLSVEEQNCFEELFSKVNSYCRETEKDEFDGTECVNLLSAFLIRLSRNRVSQNSLIRSRGAQEYNRVVTMMVNSIYDDCSLTDVARLCNISVSYVKLLFKQFSGVSPKTFYSRLRCNEAIRLLQNGLSASETSNKLNFSSPNHFSAFFKRMTGLPPVQYQKHLTNHDLSPEA